MSASSSNVTVTINGSDYPMSCSPGEEDKVRALGARIDAVAKQVAAASGPIGDSRILVMAALILTDQLSDLEGAANASLPSSSVDEDQLAGVIENLAGRIEALTSR
jgi:cell division protein ZapA